MEPSTALSGRRGRSVRDSRCRRVGPTWPRLHTRGICDFFHGLKVTFRPSTTTLCGVDAVSTPATSTESAGGLFYGDVIFIR